MKKLLFISAIFFSISALANTELQNLEKTFDGKIGVYAIDTNNNQIIAYRADERFPVQSTCKVMGVAALLKQSDKNSKLLQEQIHYTKDDLIFWHPVTGVNILSGMSLEALAEAAITYSDNVAMNLIIKELGGPNKVTDFSRSIGNKTFNIEHYEGDLNSNPAINQDNSTPKDMALSLQKLTLGNSLTQAQRTQLITWMRNNVAGNKRIRAGSPLGWAVADKTGSGDYGIANDIGILWAPTCKPVVLSIYTVQNKKEAKKREDIIASATSIVMDEFSKKDPCFNALNA